MSMGLLIIDQQKGIDHPKLGHRNNSNAESVILEVLSLWRKNQHPIFHIKHRSSEPDSVFWPHQDGFEFKEEFQPIADERVIEKHTPCAFIGTQLESVLKNCGISSIVVVGVATNNSVESTSRTAGNLGFTVFVLEDGCFTFEKNDFFGNARTAQEVHAMSLANLHGEYATVLNSAVFLRSI